MDLYKAIAIWLFIVVIIVGSICITVYHFYCYRRLLSSVEDYEQSYASLERQWRQIVNSLVRTPDSTDTENPSSTSQPSLVQANVHRAEESSAGATSSQERGRASSSRQFERWSEPSVRQRRSAGNAAGSSSQPQRDPSTALPYKIYYITYEVQPPSASALPPRTFSVAVVDQRTPTSSTSVGKSPSSSEQPIRPPAPSSQPQTSSATAPSRPTTPGRLSQVSSSSGSLRQMTPEKLPAFKLSGGPRQMTPEKLPAFKLSGGPRQMTPEKLPAFKLAGGPQTKPPPPPRASEKVKDETQKTLSIRKRETLCKY